MLREHRKKAVILRFFVSFFKKIALIALYLKKDAINQRLLKT